MSDVRRTPHAQGADIIPMGAFVSREPGKYPGQVREPKGDLPGECDWGYCDAEPVLERFSPALGWLPVCLACSQKPWSQVITEGHRG